MVSGWLTMLPYVIQMTWHNSNPRSSGWVRSWPHLIRMTNGQWMMPSGWLAMLPYFIRMIQCNLNPKSSGWLSYLMRMPYGACSLSPRWHTLLTLKSSGWHDEICVSHPDDLLDMIPNPDELRQFSYALWMTYVPTLNSSRWDNRFQIFTTWSGPLVLPYTLKHWSAFIWKCPEIALPIVW